MIEHLPQHEQAWLARFFAAPNELSWSSLLDGSAPQREADQIWRWLGHLGSRPASPLILPFLRGGRVTGWYATTQGQSSGYDLRDEIIAWLGPTWLSHFDGVPRASNDPLAAVLRDRFSGTVYRFTGSDAAAMHGITGRLNDFAGVLERQPPATRTRVRPVGAIRSDFERALLAGDEPLAEAMMVELKQTGRLNEENLRYLEVRLSAGLGLWPQIARNHWLIKTLADLALPPQVLADLIEALYRTYIEQAEAVGDGVAMRDAFARHLATPYPKLFGSRRGIRAPHVVKAFLLFERLQASPNAAIIDSLLELLPAGADTSLFVDSREPAPVPGSVAPDREDEADEAFDDGLFDRAFEFYLGITPNRKTISRLVSCVGAIGTDEARLRLLTLIDSADADLIDGLAAGISGRIAILRRESTNPIPPEGRPAQTAANPWIAWAEQLHAARDLAGAARAVQSAPTNWNVSALREDEHAATCFADLLGSLEGESANIARNAVPQIFASVFPADAPLSRSAKPIASLLFLLIAMDDTLSRSDLELLAQLAVLQIEQGLSSDDYVSLIGDLEDVQERICSYAYLPWSLDLSEALAVLPCPSNAARDARLRLFLRVLGHASGFAHRLAPNDLVPIETLAKDYGVGPEAISALKREAETDEQATALPSLDGKTIGLYTLAEAAGSRAKAALEKLFPGCKVIVNSDLVCTQQLISLARAADLFVFAWKSSSHQAFYCIKNALANGGPIWAPGKGTASILRAVLDRLT